MYKWKNFNILKIYKNKYYKEQLKDLFIFIYYYFFIIKIIDVKALKTWIYNDIYTQSSDTLNYSGLGEHT